MTEHIKSNFRKASWSNRPAAILFAMVNCGTTDMWNDGTTRIVKWRADWSNSYHL